MKSKLFADMGLACIDDVIETTKHYPIEHVVKMTLKTPESVAFANDLLMDKNSGWKLSSCAN